MTDHADFVRIEAVVEVVGGIGTARHHGVDEEAHVGHPVCGRLVEVVGHRVLSVAGVLRRHDDESVAGQGLHQVDGLDVDAAIAVGEHDECLSGSIGDWQVVVRDLGLQAKARDQVVFRPQDSRRVGLIHGIPDLGAQRPVVAAGVHRREAGVADDEWTELVGRRDLLLLFGGVVASATGDHCRAQHHSNSQRHGDLAQAN